MDPLSFEIQIKDKVTSKITEIKESLKSLKDYSIEVKLDSTQLAKIEALTTKLDSLQKAMSDSSGAKSSTKDYTDLLAVLERIEKSLNSISTGGIGKFGDTLATSMQSALDVMTKLTTELERIDSKFAKAMGTAMGRSLGKELKKEAKDASEAAQQLARDESVLSNALATTEQKAKSLSSALNILNGGGPGGGGGGEGGFVLRNIKSWHDAGSMLADIEKRITDIKSTMAAGQDLNNGFDTGRLQQFLDYYEKIAGYLKMIREGQGLAVVEGHGVVDTNQVKWHGDYAGNVKLYDQEVDAIKKVINETERLQTLRQQMTSLSQGVNNPDHAQEVLGMIKQIDAVLDRIKSSSQTEAASLFNKSYQDNVRSYEKRVSAIAKEQKDIAESAKQAVKAQNDLDTKIGRIQGKIDLAGTVDNFNPQSIEHARAIIRILEEAKEKIEALKYSGKELSEFLKSFDSNNITAQTINKLQSEIQVQKAENLNKYRADRKALTEQNQLNKSVQDAAAKYKDIQALLKEIDDQTSKAKALGLDTSGLDEAKTKLEKIRDLLDEISKQEGDKKKGMTADGRMFKDLKPDIKEATASQSQAIRASEQAVKDKEKADNQAREAEKKLGDQMDKTTQSAQKQSGALSGLKNMMGRYLSVYAASRFATEMANITGELELQKRSLEVIVGNAATANDLYGEIRDMSQMSPYTFQDLMKSTRQLSAFGIETKDLYSTMKALSDIGAGLSVDVQRLILAYGHTRSYGYLSGIQNRQFETAGIDMIGGLADRYNRLADAEERAGRAAEHVTRKDIFKKMSKRDISFEDVNAVIMELDQEGGKFYNMQEKQYETLGGKLRNLRNNYNIMMSEMGEQNKGVLMTGVNLLNELTANWQKYSKVITSLLVPLGMFKLALMAVNAMQTQQNVTLTTFTNTTLRQYGQGITSAAKSIGSSLKGLVTSAGTWITAAIAALTAIVTHFITMNREAERLAKNLAESAERDAAEIDRILSKYNGGAITLKPTKQYLNGSQVVKNNIEFNRQAMQTLNLGYELEELKRKLQALSPFYEGDLVDIFKLQTQEEQFEEIIRKIESYREANDIIAAYEDVFADSSKGGFFKGKESFETNLKDYAKSIELMGKRLRQIRTEGGLTEPMVDGFNEELGMILGDGNLTSKVENLRNYFVDALLLSEDERQKLFLSWSDGLKTVFLDVINQKDYAGFVTASEKRISGRLFGDAWRAIFGSNSMERQRDLNWNMEEVSKGLETSLASVGSYESRIATIRNRFNSSTEGAKLSENVSRYLFEGLLKDVSERLGNDDYMKFMSTEFQSDFGKRMADEIKNNPNWTSGQAFDAAAGVAENIKIEWTNAGRDVSTFWNDGFVDGLKNSAKSMANVRQAWQEMLQGATSDENGNWSYSDFYNQFSNRIRNAVETDNLGTFMGETIKKEFEDSVKELGEELKPLITKWGVNISPNIEFKSSNLAQLEEAQKELNTRWSDFDNGEGKYVKDAAYGDSLKTAKDLMDAIILIIKKGNELGFKYGEDKTQTGYKADLEKRWDERIRTMKEAYDWYDKWEKKVGEDEAFNKVQQRYGQIFDEWRKDPNPKLRFDFQARDVKDYLKYVEQIRDDALSKYQKQKYNEAENNGQEALRVYRQAVAILEEGSMDNFMRAAEEFKSLMEKTMENIEVQWDTFSKVLAATGSRSVAWALAGNPGGREGNSLSDFLVNEILKQAGQAGIGNIGFSAHLSSEQIRKMFEDAIPKPDEADEAAMTLYMEKIDGFIALYEKWQKAEIDEYKKAVDAYVSLTNNLVDTQSVAMRALGEYTTTVNALKPLQDTNPQAYRQGMMLATLNFQDKVLKAQNAYQMLMDGVVTMNHDAAQKIKSDYIALLQAQLKAGTITAKQYADEIENINQKMRALEDMPSYGRSYREGGISGVTENMSQRGKSLTEQGAAYMQQGAKTMNSEMVKVGDYMQKVGSGMQQAAGKMNSTVSIIDAIVHGINDMVQGLKGVWDEINETLDAYGDDSQKTGMGAKVNTFLGAFSEASQGATDAWDALKNGNGAGVILGVVKSWTGWFKGFAKGHDAELDEYIKNAQANQKKNQNIQNAAQRDIENSFGYAKMSKRTAERLNEERVKEKILRGFYGSGDKSDETLTAMTSALKSGSAYAAEYATLLSQRDSAINKLQNEEDKKDSDSDKIEEYKAEIAELEDQIEHFAAKTAAELWGIDVKSWASQLGDALMTAFENGEDAAKAYRDTVKSIMQQVSRNIVNTMLEKAVFEKMYNDLFTGKNAIFDVFDVEGSAPKVLNYISKQLGENGEMNKIITMVAETATSIDAMLRKNGIAGGLRNSEGSSLSTSMQGTTEETSGLIAGYINAARQDLAAVRMQEAQFISVMWPDFVEEFAQQVTSLNRIDQNVLLIMEMMQYGRGAMYEKIESIDSRFRNITNGTDKVSVQ